MNAPAASPMQMPGPGGTTTRCLPCPEELGPFFLSQGSCPAEHKKGGDVLLRLDIK